MLKAIQFGAGNIGRGFTTQLFTESGYEVVFADVVADLIDALNTRKSYPIRIVGNPPIDIPIKNIRAVNSNNVEQVAEEIATADLLCTAVGVNILKFVAPTLAKGIELRAKRNVEAPINVIICENLLDASKILKELVLKSLDPSCVDYLNTHVGFVESVVSRMVPVMDDAMRAGDPLRVCVEAYKHLPVSKKGFVGPIPDIVGFEPYDNFGGYVERKLFTHNAMHATASYLGYLKGYEYLWECMADPEIRSEIAAAMKETGEGLIKKHGFTPEQHQAHIDDLLERIGNKYLGDQVARVGRDPLRKLGPHDRLVGGARLAEEYGVTPVHMARAIAAALLYDQPSDKSAQKLQDTLNEKGLDATLESLCEIHKGESLSNLVKNALKSLRTEFGFTRPWLSE